MKLFIDIMLASMILIGVMKAHWSSTMQLQPGHWNILTSTMLRLAARDYLAFTMLSVCGLLATALLACGLWVSALTCYLTFLPVTYVEVRYYRKLLGKS